MAVIEAKNLSRWYGKHLALLEVNWTFHGGIVGLIGPNGAGKTTLLRLITGVIAPSMGFLRVLGEIPFANSRLYRHLGFAPERELPSLSLTPLEFLLALADLKGLSKKKAKERVEELLLAFDLEKAKDRPIFTFSKGMKQKVKIISALLHEPKLLVLDEPLNGMDPLARRKTLDFLRQYASLGERHILFSSHVLYEIESLTSEILLIYKGKLRAQGDIESIRKLMDQYPHRISISTPKPRGIAALLIEQPWVQGVEVEEEKLLVLSKQPEQFYRMFPKLVAEHRLPVWEYYSEDNHLEAGFQYLVSAK